MYLKNVTKFFKLSSKAKTNKRKQKSNEYGDSEDRALVITAQEDILSSIMLNNNCCESDRKMLEKNFKNGSRKQKTDKKSRR